MKTKLFLSCLLFSTMLTAQVSNLPTVLSIHTADNDKGGSLSGMFGVVPSSLSFDGTNRVYIRTADDQVAIYANDFTPVKQFYIMPIYEGEQRRKATREVIVTVSEENTSFSFSDWIETGEVREYKYLQNWGVGFFDFNNGQLSWSIEDGNGLTLTQTLFNDDEQYEYLYFPISSYAKYENRYDPEQYYCKECYSESTTFTDESDLLYEAIYSGFEVKSETGNTLQSISFPNGFEMRRYVGVQIIKLAGEYYLICLGRTNENAAMLVYKIKRNSKNAVQQIGEPVRMATYPNPVQRNNAITIQLSGEKAGKGPFEIEVTNLQGQTVEKRLIPAGQRQATVPAGNFAPGMNMIRVQQNGTTVGTTKVLAQ